MLRTQSPGLAYLLAANLCLKGDCCLWLLCFLSPFASRTVLFNTGCGFLKEKKQEPKPVLLFILRHALVVVEETQSLQKRGRTWAPLHPGETTAC